jgi:hypothetical protein
MTCNPRYCNLGPQFFGLDREIFTATRATASAADKGIAAAYKTNPMGIGASTSSRITAAAQGGRLRKGAYKALSQGRRSGG